MSQLIPHINWANAPCKSESRVLSHIPNQLSLRIDARLCGATAPPTNSPSCERRKGYAV